MVKSLLNLLLISRRTFSRDEFVPIYPLKQYKLCFFYVFFASYVLYLFLCRSNTELHNCFEI